ncbi:MAG: c-type cytochrome [Gemmatimonadota bacterium]
MPRSHVLIFLLSACFTCGGGDVPLPELTPSTIGDTAGLVARGEYIVRNLAVCGHCHAADPKNPDGVLSGGLAFENWRLGTIRASNLTADSATGLGSWSEQEIVRAIRAGEDRDGDLLAPVMPYEWFHGMADRDALAVARYLKTVRPVRNDIDNDPNLIYKLAKAFVLRVRAEPSPRAAPIREAAAPYGEYLANHVALCADCHTPREGIQNTTDHDRLFAGNDEPPPSFPAHPANLTPDSATGIGRWSEQDFMRALRTGITPVGDTLHTFMPWQQFRRMTDDDLRAIYRYLRTLPAIRNRITRRQ